MQNPAFGGRRILLMSLLVIALLWATVSLGWPSGLTGGLLTLFVALAAALVFRAERRMSEQLQLQRKFIDHTSEAMMVTDPAQRILMVNPAFERITGYLAAEIVGQTPAILASGRHGVDFYQAIWARVAEKGEWEGEAWDKRKGGEIYPKQMRIKAIHDAAQETVSHYLAVFSDISGLKAQEARIDYLAHHDLLTSLPNRLAMGMHLGDALSNAARCASRLAVVIIDLDNFKTVNDSLGHHAGDQLLNEIARRLQLELDWRGRLFRLGGDEFVVVLEEAEQLDQVVELLDRLIQTVGEPCQVLGHQLHTSPSIGVSFFPGDGENAETLIRNADTAMYYAKANGRNNYQFFAEPMSAAANKRLHLESELWDALAQNQLLLHYQPQVDLLTGSVVGVEALVRWQHPQRGMIAPDDFIPLAEECGLILPLGHWVLLTACRQARLWLDSGVDIGEIAVNISAHQFRQPDFAQVVHSVLLETGLPPNRLELEITESTVMHSAESSVGTLAVLKEMGVKLAIDDFGTGYSSLAYLRMFPVDRLKIDRAFVADVASDSDAASLVTSIIALGRSLGLNLVAEGVETLAQADFLRALDCQRVQGFHFFRPVAAEEVAAVSDFFRLAKQAA